MTPRIGYLAMLCNDATELARFYRTQFGMDELDRSVTGDVSLTDGSFNLTLFRRRPELREPHMDLGLHHLGIAVDDVNAIVARYKAHYPRGTVVAEAGDLQHGEVRIFDPECNPVSLSQRNFGLPGPAQSRTPHIAHIALNALNTESILEFYQTMFGFRELFAAHKHRTEAGYRNKHVGDGFTNVAIQAFYNDDEGHEARFGVAHFGFLVQNSSVTAEEVVRAGAIVKPRPAIRTQSEARMRDPEGNGCDLSQRGWEVDTGKWARAAAS